MGVRGRWAALRAAGPQRGATTSLGMAIVVPVLLLATFGAITYAQWSYAGNLAQGAAQLGSSRPGCPRHRRTAAPPRPAGS